MKPLEAVRSVAFVAVGLATLLPSAISAELVADSVAGQTPVAMLDRLQDQAMAIAQSGAPDALERALFLHGQVVHRRAVEDPDRLECLKTHARLLDHYGRPDAALMYMEEAAAQAVMEGNDYEAATAFIQAAILAEELGQIEEMRHFLGDANGILSASTRLDWSERVALSTQLGR